MNAIWSLSLEQLILEVRGRLGRMSPHADAIELVDTDFESNAQFREVFRHAIARLLHDAEVQSGGYSTDELIDLITVAAFVLHPTSSLDVEDRRMSVDALCSLAQIEGDVGSAAQGALLSLREPATSTFWLELAASHAGAPLLVILQGLADADPDSAIDCFVTEAESFATPEAALGLLVPLLRRMDAADRASARAALTRLVATLPDEVTRRAVLEAPALAGLEWRIREPPASERYLAAIGEWRRLEAKVMSAERLAAARGAIAAALRDAFLLFDRGQREVVIAELTADITQPPGDALAAVALDAVAQHRTLASTLIATIDGSAWELAEWYLRVSGALPGDGSRAKIVAEVCEMLPDYQQRVFLQSILSQRRSAPEVMENYFIDQNLILGLELLDTDVYRKVPADLDLKRFEAIEDDEWPD